MNSTPVEIRARVRASSVLAWAAGTPSQASSRLIVEIPTPDALDNSDTVIRSSARAARSCSLVIKSQSSYTGLYGPVFGSLEGIDGTAVMADARPALNQTLGKIDGAYAPSTIRAYRADFLDFIAFCESRGEAALPGSPPAVADFIGLLMQRGKRSASIRRAIAGIASIHSFSGHADPTKHLDVKLAIRRMHRQIGRHHHQALGITGDVFWSWNLFYRLGHVSHARNWGNSVVFQRERPTPRQIICK